MPRKQPLIPMHPFPRLHVKRPGLTMLLGLAALAWTSNARAVTLVENGAPQAVLIVEAEAKKSMQAAEALQRYVEKMSGATLPLVVEGQELPADAPAGRIHVGHTAAAKGQNVPAGFDTTVRAEAFEEEGFVLRTLDENTLLVAGNNDGPYRGTIFAAYALLEKLGCRFYFPGDWGELLPETTTLALTDLDLLERPDFPVRRLWLSGWVSVSREEKSLYAEWCDKMRFSDNFYPRSHDGSLGSLLPHGEFFEKHPEFYAMNRSGERQAGRMLCLSNTNMVETVLERLRRAFAGDLKVANVQEFWPGTYGAGFSPPDGAPYCFCENCRAAAQNFRYPYYGFSDERPMMSEEFFRFTARIASEFPDKWFLTMAYSLREMPPQGVKLPDNVILSYAPITSDVLYPGDTLRWRRNQTMEILRQWREQTPHVYMRDYNPGFLLGMFVPERDTENLAVNVPLYHEMQIKGMGREGRKAFMQTWLSYYTTAKLLWDADTSVESIKDEFYPAFFGPEAGPHVRAWWDACAARLLEGRAQAHEDWIVNDLYNQAFADRIHAHVKAALASEATPAQRERLEGFALIAENLESFAAMNDAWRRLDFDAAATAADRMVEIKEELHAIYSFFISPRRRVSGGFANGHRDLAKSLAARLDGTRGERVAELPLQMRFRRDPFEEGVIQRWYRADWPDDDWELRDTFYTLEQQEEPLNKRGFHYNGYVWYRADFDVPERFTGRDVELYLGGLVNEGWVWVNGEYVDHRPWAVWWHRNRHPVEFAVGDKLRPGERNTIAIRVLNSPDEVGGLYRRGFLYAPVSQEE